MCRRKRTSLPSWFALAHLHVRHAAALVFLSLSALPPFCPAVRRCALISAALYLKRTYFRCRFVSVGNPHAPRRRPCRLCDCEPFCLRGFRGGAALLAPLPSSLSRMCSPSRSLSLCRCSPSAPSRMRVRLCGQRRSVVRRRVRHASSERPALTTQRVCERPFIRSRC